MKKPSVVPMARTIGITTTGLMWDFSRRLDVTIPDQGEHGPDGQVDASRYDDKSHAHRKDQQE